MSTSAATVANTLPSLSMHSFVDEMRRIHDNTAHQSFAFLLGAGTSVSSGIPPAARLARNWLEELHKQDPAAASVAFDAWLAAGSHGVTGLDAANLAASYPAIFDRRFGTNPNLGYAVLTNLMKDAEPGFGYSVLATMLASTRHNTVITTNFDNLVERALLYYTNHTPLTCTHETTAGIFRRAISRPLIIKCHRDLLLEPHNGKAGTSKLDEKYGAAIKSLLPGKALIVIGYGGNDGSLMDCLERLEETQCPEAVYWCYWIPDGPPTGRAAAWIAQRHGSIVPIDGFDELFYHIRKKFDLPLLDSEMERLHTQRKAKYREQAEAIANRMGEGDAPSAAVSASAASPMTPFSPAATSVGKGTKPTRESPRDAKTSAKGAETPIVSKLADESSAWEALLPVLEMPDNADKHAVFESLRRQYPNDPDVLDHHATFLREQGRLADAAPLAENALTLAKSRFGADSAQVARFYNNLALIQHAQGDLLAARTNIDRSIAINLKHHSEDHPHLATNYGNLALILRDQGNLRDARANLERAIAIMSAHLAPDHYYHAINGYKLGLIEAAEGKKAEACKTFNAALALFRKHFRDDHYRVVKLLKAMKDNGCPT